MSPGYGGLDVADRLRHGLIHLHLLRDELAAFLSNRGEHVDCNIDITDIHLLLISNICTVSTQLTQAVKYLSDLSKLCLSPDSWAAMTAVPHRGCTNNEIIIQHEII